MADEAPFLNSCVAGITAEASSETSAELKSLIGVLAYVLSSLRIAKEFTGLELSASVVQDGVSHTVWKGAATFVLVGNGRLFSTAGTEQANLEDGFLDVTIITDGASMKLATDHLWE